MATDNVITHSGRYQNRVYMACLGCYNEGRLKGAWMNAKQLRKALDSNNLLGGICVKPHHDEWAIHDYDGALNEISQYLGEHPYIGELVEHMEHMEEDPHSYIPAYLLAKDYYESPDVDTVETIANEFFFIEDIADWAYEFCLETGMFTEPDGWSPLNYVNWERVGNDMLMDYYHIKYGGQICAYRP